MKIVRKPRVQWSIELNLSEQCPESSLADNWSKWGGHKLKLTGFSCLTFEQGKITQDIQTLDVLSLMVEMHQMSSNPMDSLPLLLHLLSQ